MSSHSAMFGGSLFTEGRKYWKYESLVTTTVFHWFTSAGGNLSSAWVPLGGRQRWTGEPDWWQEQIKQMMLANIDIIYLHLTDKFEEQRLNFFTAYAALRAEGYDPPKIAPFLDPFGIWPPTMIDVATVEGKNSFAAQYIRFFEQYLSVNTDPVAGTFLAHIENRVVLGTWWVLYILTNLEQLSRSDLETRLEAAFPAHPQIFQNGIWMASTAVIDPDLGFSDERMVMYSGLHYCVQTLHNNIRTFHLQAGYWDQNIRRPGLFMPRVGGRIYRNVWEHLTTTYGRDVHRYYIESWNEYDEGSGIYAAETSPPVITEYNQAGNTDQWSEDNDPFEYIRTTRAGASKINGLPEYDAISIASNYPSTVRKGTTMTFRFCVRNQGNALWGINVGIGVYQPLSSSIEKPLPCMIDFEANELENYGGVFRGRPVAFRADMRTPEREGQYEVTWRMFYDRDDVQNWFGQEILTSIRVI